MTEQSDPRSSSAVQTLMASVSRYVKLLIEDTRLNATEKLTRLFSAITIFAIVLVLGLAALLFLSVAVAEGISDFISPIWAYIILAAFYAILAGVVVLCRNSFIVNPIARFISRLLLDAPENTSHHDKSSSLS